MDQIKMKPIPDNLLCKVTDVGGYFKGLGPLGDTLNNILGGSLINPDVNPAISLLNRLISIGVGLITLFAFLYFILQFFTAALKWITAGGDQKSIEAATKQITNSLIGLVIVTSAIFVIDLLGNILGIDILSPFGFIVNLWQ